MRAALGAGLTAAATLAVLAVPASPASGAAGARLLPHRVLVVAQDGRPGHYGSVQAAIDAVPAGRGPVTIRV